MLEKKIGRVGRFVFFVFVFYIFYVEFYHNFKIYLDLTLTAPRKPASENVVC